MTDFENSGNRNGESGNAGLRTSARPARHSQIALLAGASALSLVTLSLYGFSAFSAPGVMSGQISSSDSGPVDDASVKSPPEAASAVPPTLPSVPGLNDPNIFVNLSRKVMPSVVNISAISRPKRQMLRRTPTPEDLFENFGGFPGFGPGQNPHADPYDREENRPHGSLGTGFIIDPSGIILTNHHVIAGSNEIKIFLTEDPNEKPLDGEVLGKDAELDVALIRVRTDRKLVALPLGDSEQLQVGEYVAAIGNPFGQGHSVSHGIVSAKGRIIPGMPMATYLQTDAPINPGNSGGPLINLKGEVIGINNAVDARAQGIGFAIPMQFVKPILAQLKEGGSISRGYLGAIIGSTPGESSPVVGQVYVGSPAHEAGLKPRDIILEFNGKPVRSSQELVTAVSSQPAEKKVSLKIQREGHTRNVDVRLGKRPASQT